MSALLLVALAGATEAVVLSPTAELGTEQAIYLEVDDAGCADVDVVDATQAAVLHSCQALGAAGAVLVLVPDDAWPVEGVSVGVEGARTALDVTYNGASSATAAVPVDRTLTSGGISYRLCHDGVVSQVARAAAEPASPGDGIALAQLNGEAWFGAADGSWPAAAPGAQGTFWFRAWGEDGAPSDWASDEVSLVDEGLLRTDLRLGADPENGLCPDADASWALGEELEADGGELPDAGTKDRAHHEEKGCGGQSAAWFGLPLLLLIRRRYQTSSGSK